MPTKENNKEIRKRINAYIDGRLSIDEVKRLWDETSEDPKWMAYLNDELAERE